MNFAVGDKVKIRKDCNMYTVLKREAGEEIEGIVDRIVNKHTIKVEFYKLKNPQIMFDHELTKVKWIDEKLFKI